MGNVECIVHVNILAFSQNCCTLFVSVFSSCFCREIVKEQFLVWNTGSEIPDAVCVNVC